MKRMINFSAALMMSMPMMAGGYLTNTNQSIDFLRNPARDASVGVDGVYYNPAGVAFMKDGWHLQFNWQTVHQHRDTWSDYVMNGKHLFTMNKERPTTEETDWKRKSKGRVDVPIQPSLFLAYNKDGWSLQFGSGFIGGGGSCEFENGVGSFEYLGEMLAMTQMAAQKLPMTAYGMDSYMKGTSYDLGFSFAAARRVTKNLNVSLGLRGVFAINSYEGYLRNLKAYSGDRFVDLSAIQFQLDCRQHGFGVTPIIGIDYRLNKHLNFAAKYEFKTKLKVKSSSDNNTLFDNLAATTPAFAGYLDGAETSQDIPSLLTVGVQYSPIDVLRISAGYHHYFDADTEQWFETQVGNTNEFTLGAECDVTKALQVSAGYQKTIYDQTSDFHTDTNFNLDSYSIGFGVGLRVSEAVKVNAAYFRTIYDNFNQIDEPVQLNAKGEVVTTKNVTYSRTNQVFGVGVEVDF